jgi:hypothetical protein
VLGAGYIGVNAKGCAGHGLSCRSSVKSRRILTVRGHTEKTTG